VKTKRLSDTALFLAQPTGWFHNAPKRIGTIGIGMKLPSIGEGDKDIEQERVDTEYENPQQGGSDEKQNHQ
jgi:hypothetical protein